MGKILNILNYIYRLIFANQEQKAYMDEYSSVKYTCEKNLNHIMNIRDSELKSLNKPDIKEEQK